MNEASPWLPIESAPKDGTEILAWRSDCGPFLARWTCIDELRTTSDKDRDELDEDVLFAKDWFGGDSEGNFRADGSEPPTHWMPLPKPPAASSPQAPTNAQTDDCANTPYDEGPFTLLADRSPQDYAIEHAEYMAKDAEALLLALEQEDALRLRRAESDDVDADEVYDAGVSRAELATGLRSGIFEFRKRRDRAASPEGLARPQTEEKPDSGWQPIESAPKMRSVILWADTSTPDFPNWHMGSGHFSTDLNAWIWEGETVREWAHPPTHWMPLPPAPGDMAVSLRDAKDAERYRWLRSDDIVVGPNQREIYVVMDGMPHTDEPRTVLIESELDAAIDAAILATKGG